MFNKCVIISKIYRFTGQYFFAEIRMNVAISIERALVRVARIYINYFQRVKGLKQAQGKPSGAKHSATEQHMARLAAASAVTRAPVQLISKASLSTTIQCHTTPTTLTVPVSTPAVPSLQQKVSMPTTPSVVTSPSVVTTPSLSVSIPAPIVSESKITQPVKVEKEKILTTPKVAQKRTDSNSSLVVKKVMSKKSKLSAVTPSVPPGTTLPSKPAPKAYEPPQTICTKPIAVNEAIVTKKTSEPKQPTHDSAMKQVAAALRDVKKEPEVDDYQTTRTDQINQPQPNNKNILMHYIEGFIIEEGPEPFPVSLEFNSSIFYPIEISVFFFVKN